MADYTFTLPSDLQSKEGIDSWAEKYEYESEQPLIDMKTTIQKQGYMTKEQLQKLVEWKSPRSKRHIAPNDPKDIQEITQSAFETKGYVAILMLWGLDGVWSPVASAILHFFHKEDYPIIDTRALWTLTKKKLFPHKYQFNYSLWKQYVIFCRDTAKKYGVSMRELDKALWQYGKDDY